MNQTDQWAAVDAYFAHQLHAEDPNLTAAIAHNQESGIEDMAVSEIQGKFLMLQAQAIGAERILEIGTLGAYSSLWMARGLAPGGKIVTLEKNARTAQVARENIHNAGADTLIEVVVGDADQILKDFVADGEPAFDLIFIDADKPMIPKYAMYALELSHPGTVIIIDNVARDGAIADPENHDSDVLAVRTWAEVMGLNERLECTVVQTVGAKGHDGFAYCVVQ